jgi:hypothetical protein
LIQALFIIACDLLLRRRLLALIETVNLLMTRAGLLMRFPALRLNVDDASGTQPELLIPVGN